MTDLAMFSKERSEDFEHGSEDEEPSGYYYDDSTHYRVYDPEVEDDDTEDNQEKSDQLSSALPNRPVCFNAS
jgi:hypothetical protein